MSWPFATGFAMLASHSVQAVMDMALIAHAATLESRLPFVHFFDGFRTSHEVAKVEQLTLEDMRAMIDDDLVRAHRARSLNPDRPVLRGTAQNPDVYFQARETVNPFYDACPDIVQRAMDRFAALTGRQYRLFDYFGAPDAERVVVLMGSGALAAEECVEALLARGEKVGVVNVHLFRPFSAQAFVRALAADRARNRRARSHQGAGKRGRAALSGRSSAMQEAGNFAQSPRVIGGRYGLASKEFTPAMAAAFSASWRTQTAQSLRRGHHDDVTHRSLDYDPAFSTEDPETVRAVFYGLGADGTVGANKNSIKIIGEDTDNYAQGYFVYDSKKSGAMTISHLRFGRKPIRASYLITRQLRRLPSVLVSRAHGCSAPRGAGRDVSAQQPVSVRMRCGIICRNRSSARSSRSICGSTSSMPTAWPRTTAWAAASTPSCRRASLP